MKLFMSTVWALSFVVMGAILATAQGKVNFSGTWLLDKSKSDMAQLVGMGGERAEKFHSAGLSMVVEQRGTTLKVTRTLNVEGEERKQTYAYKTDGTKTTNTGPRGGAIVSKANWKGDNLVIVSSRKLTMLWKEFSADSKEVWSLSPDGKTLTIDTQIHSPRGDPHFKAVFDKQ